MNETTNQGQPGFTGGQVLAAFLGGAVAGAAVAYLTAPRTGAQTRALIREKAQASGESAAKIPKALSGAVGAARDAFSESLTKAGEQLHS